MSSWLNGQNLLFSNWQTVHIDPSANRLFDGIYCCDRRRFDWYSAKQQHEKESLILEIILTSCLSVRFKSNNGPEY